MQSKQLSFHRCTLLTSFTVFVFVHCCRGKVRGLAYVSHMRQLFSSGDDAMLIVWDMTAKRKEVCFQAVCQFHVAYRLLELVLNSVFFSFRYCVLELQIFTIYTLRFLCSTYTQCN